MAYRASAEITVLTSLSKASSHCPGTAGQEATWSKEAQWPKLDGLHAGLQDTAKSCPICDICLGHEHRRLGAFLLE